MGDTLVSALHSKLNRRTCSYPYTFLKERRDFSRVFLNTFYSLLTSTTVEGIENIPEKGPLLVLPNHLSNLDGPLVLAMYPQALEMLGPRDFKMEPFKMLMMSVYGMTLIKRGYSDSSAVNNVIKHLRSNKHLLMFPSGGMWEKRSFENKQGAPYFSQLTQTPILPVGISGTYLQSHSTLTTRRPKLVLRFGKVIDPVSNRGSRAEREVQLQKANRSIETEMFGLLEPSEQERYQRWQRESYSMEIRFKTSREVRVYRHYSEGAFPCISEFAIKPNLFRPMWKHAAKDMSAFMTGRVSSVEKVRTAVQGLYENLTQDFSQYLPYRLGEESHGTALREIEELKQVCTIAENEGADIQLVPSAYDPLKHTVRTKPVF
ncbi:MAG: 1-acyl-sn-glycerol-3-phosphate acyltransferase [Spirochaetia bacterium]|nr:1-acyl-sn-glycerol-3-phosphate acyltransferase [Spirochaetia bacterium]